MGRRAGKTVFVALAAQRTHTWRVVEGGVTYSAILIVRGMMVAAEAAQQLLLQLPRQP